MLWQSQQQQTAVPGRDFCLSGITGDPVLRITARAVPFVFFMLIVVLPIAGIPAISAAMLPDTLE